MVWPTEAVPMLACLSMLMHAVYVSVTVSVSVSVTVPPTGGVPVAVAVFVIGPGRSPSITVYVAVPVVEPPGLRVVVPSVIVPSLLSITVTLVR